jgi:hypothetical protein
MNALQYATNDNDVMLHVLRISNEDFGFVQRLDDCHLSKYWIKALLFKVVSCDDDGACKVACRTNAKCGT